MYYKDINNKVYFIELGFEHMLPSGCVQIPEEEALALARVNGVTPPELNGIKK